MSWYLSVKARALLVVFADIGLVKWVGRVEHLNMTVLLDNKYTRQASGFMNLCVLILVLLKGNVISVLLVATMALL